MRDVTKTHRECVASSVVLTLPLIEHHRHQPGLFVVFFELWYEKRARGSFMPPTVASYSSNLHRVYFYPFYHPLIWTDGHSFLEETKYWIEEARYGYIVSRDAIWIRQLLRSSAARCHTCIKPLIAPNRYCNRWECVPRCYKMVSGGHRRCLRGSEYSESMYCWQHKE